MASETDWLTKYPEVEQKSWLDKYPEAEEKPFFDLSDTLSATGRAFTSLGTSVPASMRQAFGGLENPWQRSESYMQSRADMQALQEELNASEAAAMEGGDASSVSSSIREATPSLGFSGSTLVPSLAAGAVTALATKSPVAARSAAAGTSLLMAYRMAGAQFLDDSRERIDNFFQEKLQRPLTPEEQNEAYEELLPLARKFGAAEAGPEALGNMALGGAGKYIRKALGGKNGIMSLASNALSKVTGAKAVGAGIGAAAGEVGTEAITAVEQDRINKEFEQSVLRGEAPESVVLPDRTVQDYTKGITEVAPTTLAMTGLMGLAGLGPTALNRGYRALRPQAEQQAVETEIVPEEPAPAPEPPSQIIPKELVVKANETSPDVSSSTTAFVELNENLLKTQAEGAADKAAQMLAQEQAAQAQVAAELQAQLEAPTPEQPLAQEPQAPVELPVPTVVPTVETPSPAMEQIEKPSQTITDFNGEIAPEMPVPPPTVEAGAGVGEAPVSRPTSGRKPVLAPQVQEMLAQAAAINAGTQTVAPSTNEFVQKMTGQVAPPITPTKETPTPATEGTVMPGGSAMERDLLKPYANISIPDLEALPESDWSRRRDYLDGKMRNNQQEKSNLLKTPKSNWESREYNENARINDVAASLRAAIQDMQSARPDLEKVFTKSKSRQDAEEIQSGDARRERTELQQQPETLPSISEQPKVTEAPRESRGNIARAGDIAGNVVASNAQRFAANIRAQFKADELADKAEKLKEKYYSINASAGKRESESKNKTLQQWKQTEAKAKQAKANAFAELRKQNKGFTVAQLEDREPFMAAKTLEQHGLTKLATDVGYTRQGELYVFSPQTTTVATPTETAAPLAKEAAVASVVQQPAEGSIPAVEQESATTAIESNEKADIGYGAKLNSARNVIRGLGPDSIMAQQQALNSLLSMSVAELQSAFEVLTGDTTKLANKRQLANNILNEILGQERSGESSSVSQIFKESEKEAAVQEVVDESTDLNPITDEMVESSLTPVEKREAAIILGKKTWADSKALFKQRMADWMAGANETSKKLIKFFKTVANKARLLLAASIGLSMANSTSDVNLATSDQFRAFKIPVSSILNSKPARPQFGSLPDMSIGIPEQKIPLGLSNVELNKRPQIDTRGKKISSDAAKTAQWVLDTADSEGYPFIVTDKIGATMYFFDEKGVLLKKSPVLVGKNVGDFIGNTDAGRITPSGRFEIAPETDATYGNVFSVMGTDMVDSETGELVEVAIHRLALHDPSEKRPQRIATATPLDNRISWGCMNLDNKVMDWAFNNYPLGGLIYILPETAKGRSVFAPLNAANIESSKQLAKNSNVDLRDDLKRKEDKKLEAAQKKREELNLKTLNSLIQKTRTNVVQGTVKATDANQAVAILNRSGEIPNVLFTWIGTSKDFLADPANRVRYPETWAAVSANSKIEGMSENGQPIVFTDNVGVSDLDRKLANLQGTTPEVAAVRRVILHENIHKGMFFLSMKEKMQIFAFLRRMYSPEELDSLAKSYSEYSDWRTNQVSYFSILEEAMTRDFDSMVEIPRDGIWAEFMQFLRGIWQKITGKTSEPTLKDYKDVFRLIRNSLKNSEKANADMLVNGGKTKYETYDTSVRPYASEGYGSQRMEGVSTGDNSPRAQAIRKAVSESNWNELSPTQRAKALEEFGLQSIQSRYSFDTAILPVRVTNERTPKNRPASVLSSGATPTITIQFDTTGLADLLNGDAVTAFANVFDMAQEEVIHAAQHLNIYNRWKSSNSTDSVGLYELKYYTSMINEVAQIAGDELRNGNSAVANVFTNAWNLYNPNDQASDVNDAISKIKTAPEAAAFAMELSRMMLQMQRQDFTSETGWMRFVEAMKALLNDITNALKTALAMAKNGQVGKRLQDEISEVNALMNELESASQPIASKVEYDSPNDAAFNSGAEVARNTDYDQRDKEVRSTIRAAYDIAPKTNGPSVPLDELFSIVKQSMPDLTETEFSRILQGLYEDSGALLIEGESPFATFTTEGERAGSVIVMPPSGFQTRAMASMIDPKDAATKQFAKNIKDINSGTAKAAFDGVQFVDFEPVDHIVKPNKSYEQVAIDYVNSFIAEGGTLEQMANSVISPDFLSSIGIEDDVKARQALVAEVKNRIVNTRSKKKSKVDKKFFERLNNRVSSFWQGLGTKSGGNQGQRAYIIGNPRYSWMFLSDEVEKDLKERRDNILTVQFGNDNATSFTQNSYENSDKANQQAMDENINDAEEAQEFDQDAADLAAGEATLTGAFLKLYEDLKDLLRQNGLIAKARASRVANAAKASISDTERNAIMSMSDAELNALESKNNKRIGEILNTLLGKEETADTTEKKTVRKKREKMVEIVRKRLEQGKTIDFSQQIDSLFTTENPQRDEIIDDVSNALLQAAKKRGVKPSQKTALADLVASIKSLLKRNIKGEDLKADEAPLGQLLARTYLDNLTATEAKLFAQSWKAGREKVRAMLTEMGVEGTQLEAELNAIMPETPTIAYNPSAVRKAITRALREAGLDANDLLANTQSVKSEILKVWDKAAVDAGLTPSVWQEGRKLAEKSIDEFVIERKASKEKAKQIAKVVSDQANNPVSLADFSNSLSQFKLNDSKVKELFDKAKVLANKKVQIANDRAIRVLFEAENNLAQSAFFNSTTKPDTIVKAFREQVSDPMSRQDFKDRMDAMKVSGELADRLFDKAAREKDNAQWKLAQDMLEGPNALRNILREINRARPGNQAPLSEQIPWRQLLSQSAKTVEEYRQRILDAISANESLKNATPEQKARLAELFTEAWETKRKRILDSMQERLIREQEAKGNLSKKAAKALQENRMRIVEDINLGIFDNDEIAKIIAEKFGIKSEFTDEERQKIESLIAILQDETLNRVKRNKAAYELLETLSAQTDISIAKLLANFWVSSVLSGMNTVFSIGMSVFSGMGELTTALSRIFSAAFSNPKQLSSEVAAAFKTLARVISAVPRQANRAWQYLVTGDQAFLDPSMNDALKNMDYASIGKNNQLAEQMAKSDKILEKSMGLFMRTVSRLLTALDLFNSGLTKEGSLSIVFRQLDLDPAKIQMLEKKSDLKAYKDQVIRDYFNNVQPKTLNEKALVDSYAMAEMMKALDEIGNVSENADQMAMQGAMTLDPSGLGGYGYRFVKSMMKSAESGTDKLLERNLRKWDEAVGVDEKAEAGVRLVLSYIFQFAAYNAANLVGVRFARFAGNKFNQSLSFLPLIGALRLYEAEFDSDRIRGKEAFTDMIKRNQITGVIAAVIGYYVLKAIAEEPDDEKRGAFINGGWSNLTPEKKQQKLASGQKEYTLGFGDTVINYGNWPGSGILAAIGGLSDLIRFSPDQWNDKTVANKLLSATTSGVFSAMEVPALSQFQELFGSSLSSKDPNEQKLTKFARVIGNYVGGFVPRILKDIDYISDPNFRKYETLWEKTASHIPVYRRYEGKEYYDILGQQIQRNVYPGSREFMVKPTDPAYRVLGALNSRGIWLTPANAEHRMVGKGARRRSLTQEEADNYSLETGKGYKQMLLRYGQRALQMPTERAKAFLLDKADEVRDRALKKVYRGYQPAT